MFMKQCKLLQFFLYFKVKYRTIYNSIDSDTCAWNVDLCSVSSYFFRIRHMKNVQRVQSFATDVNLYYVFSFSSKVLSVNFNTLNKGCKCGKDGSLMQKIYFLE